MGRIPTIKEAREALDLKHSHIEALEDTPGYWEKKREYCMSVGKDCKNGCDNFWCNLHPDYQSPYKEVTK